MFESLTLAPADPILGLTELFQQEPNPRKVNLGVGVYKNAAGGTPVLAAVQEAERRLLDQSTSKTYLPIAGHPQFGAHIQTLLFGAGHRVVRSNRARTAHTPGGTGALRVTADFLHRHSPASKLWLSDPTWENHRAVFAGAGVETALYPYYDAATRSLDFSGMLAALGAASPGDAVLLHACCHNPTGIDPEPEQWEQLAALLAERSLLPLLDFAYQGFGHGLEEDAAGLRTVVRHCPELIVCSSYSKNFGLYNERVGAMTLVAASAEAAERAFSNVKPVIRTNYSNPPAHGAAVVSLILDDPDLRQRWEGELTAMRTRIRAMREQFVAGLARHGVNRDFSFITRQNGMFSFSGLGRGQVQALRDRFGIYIVGSGRINVAGMTEGNMDYLCEAIAAVL
ncbi:MAG: aspartate/tyrosine/aromatic aminotransferase [Deferrisomatales bacterium]|nr:aspartate/tyrosine/aromatic aminotransferase [Deferrisomatales bacterium]